MVDETTRRWWVGAAVSAAVSLAAVVGLLAWSAGRPAPSAGTGIAALGPSPAGSATPVTEPSRRATARPARPPEPAPSAPEPRRLRIPDLDVDASVAPVGVQDDGAMVIPAAPTSVGWYRFGSAPSDPAGNTVVAGHVATREDGPGALAPLVGAEVGMEVEVVDADGTTHRYSVEGRESIRKKALPVEEIFARDGTPRLVIVTCGGEYVPELRSHRDNVVVTAVPVS